MKVLKIEYSESHQPIATVFSNLDGTFRIDAENSEDQRYFSELINKISQEHPVLPLISGGEKKDGEKITSFTTKADILNTDI